MPVPSRLPARERQDEKLDALASLLVAGGDERMRIDPATGRNPYGRTTLPEDDALELGSCTSSAISRLAIEACERARRALDAPMRIREASEHVRAGLLGVFGLDERSGVEVVLAPSGTDAELVPLLLASCQSDGPLHNVLVGPGEAGSGTSMAAGGRYPYDQTPFGGLRGAGRSVGLALTDRAGVHAIGVRNADGTSRPLEAIDGEAEALVERLLACGGVALLHRIAHSKTGVFAPSLACLSRIRERYGDRVLVVVDAAQARYGAASARKHLERGDLVLVTGSKFYGGPPFSGAVLVPARWARVDARANAPTGIFDYLSASDLPPAWRRLRERCSTPHNLGLVMRWTAALSEMNAYRAIPAIVQREIIAGFGRSVQRWMASSRALKLREVPPIDPFSELGEVAPEEDLPTVFSFSLLAGEGGARRALGAGELKRIQRRLAADERGERFHIGQPVRLAPDGSDVPAVLRVAIGAPLVRRVASDPSLGERLADRIAWLDARIAALVAKIHRVLDAEPS